MGTVLLKLKLKIRSFFYYFCIYPVNIFLIFPLFLFLKKFFLKKKDVKFVLFDGHKIGHMALCTEPFIKKLYEKKLKKNDKFLFLIFFIKPIANNYYHYLIKKNLKRKNVIILSNYIIWLNFCKLYKLITKKNILIKNNARQKLHKINNDNNIIIKIPVSDNITGEKIIKKLGILRHNKWICITNRDSEYLKKTFKGVDSRYHDYRDFSIGTMKKAIEYFISKDYYVVRMGSLMSEKLNFEHELFIDYPFSQFKNDFLDIYLSAKCCFYFGSGAGISNVSRLFRRPMFMINQVPFKGVFLHKNKLQIFKKLKDKNTNEILSINEILKRKLFDIGTSKEFINKKIEIISNNEDEILELAKEALSLHENNFQSLEKKSETNHKNMQELLKNHDLFKNLYWRNKIGKDFISNLNI